MRRASRCPGPLPTGHVHRDVRRRVMRGDIRDGMRIAMPGPASQALHSHEVVAICCSVLAWQIATTFLRYRPGNGRDLPLCSSVANRDHFFGLFKRKMVAKCHVCTEWHFATSRGTSRGTSPRDQPTARDDPCSKALPCVRDDSPSLTARMPPPWQRQPRGACWPPGRSWARSGSRRCRR